MSFPVTALSAAEFPPLLREIPQPPKALNYRGSLPSPELKLLAVVGSRKYSDYGKQVVEHIIAGLAGYPVGIVSGLALGIDSLAHQAALDANLFTLAIPGSGLDDSVIYPAKHRPLARKVLEAGGGLLSEFEPTFSATKWSFPQRNRLVCGIAHGTLLIEAAEQSGTLITARLTADYNRELLVVPGNIFSKNSKGVHQFLKLGATPVTEPNDILLALGIEPQEAGRPEATPPTDLSYTQQIILELLHEPTDIDTLIRTSNLPTTEVNIVLMQLEMKGLIKESQGRYFTR